MHVVQPFEAVVHLPADTHPISVHVPKDSNLRDLVGTLAAPSHLVLPLYSVFLTAAAEIRHGRADPMTHRPTHRSTDLVTSTHRHDFCQRYQTHTLQYHPKPDQVTFARAYHTLVHCPVAAIFDTLLKLEDKYASCMQALLDDYQHKQRVIHERYDGNNPNAHAVLKEESDILEATFASDVDQTQRTQREEYRDFVIELYQEYRRRLAALATDEQEALGAAKSKLDAKEIVNAVLERVSESGAMHASPAGSIHSSGDRELLVRRRQNSSASLSSLLSDTPPRTAPNDASLQRMQEMGIERETAEEALRQTDQDVELAIARVFDTGADAGDKLPQQSTSTPYRRSSSLSQVQRPTFSNAPSPVRSRNNSCNESVQEGTSRRHSLQKMATTPALFGGSGIGGSARPTGWSPISFLQQQKQVMKLGAWFGKVADNLESSGSPLPGDPPNRYQELVESFTISLGTAHIKSTHNLRLLAADMGNDYLNPIPYSPHEEMAYRAQMATRLYTSHLSAMVVLVEQRDLASDAGWHQYMSGKTNNKALFDRCQRLTEFHFATMEAQLTEIKKDMGDTIPEEGTVFITRHSNLPLTQVVFHLVVNDETEKEPFDQQHALIKGLRNVLHIATRFDISSLIIPLLLLPDRCLNQPEALSVESLRKRGEAAMKCVRGFLIEHSQSRKHASHEHERSDTVLGADLRTVEFLLPRQRHTASSATQPEVETFKHFRNQLKSLFPTS